MSDSILSYKFGHDKVVAMELVVSAAVKRPAHKEQHLCADKAYDSNKRRGIRTRWSKKAANWLAFIQFACARLLLNLAVFG